MKRRFATSWILFLMVIGAAAQTAREEIHADIRRTGSNFYAYPVPEGVKLTPAPKGEKPFYISHYGRHGSRYSFRHYYDDPWNTLTRADELSKLTPLGKDVLRRATLLRDEANLRDGDLTELGAEQHRGIARRMFERFPEVFRGEANVDAKSTTSTRCIISMENALQELVSLNPRLHVKHDASEHDAWYLKYIDRELMTQRSSTAVQNALNDFRKGRDNYERLMRSLFNDDTYWQQVIDARKLRDDLFYLAGNIQSTELRHSVDLYDIFTEDELYDHWLLDNAGWYLGYAPCPLDGGTQQMTERFLLRKMIEEADSCLALERPGATLRYGHEICVLPLAALMELDDCGLVTTDFEHLADRWRVYNIIPMGCNVQLIFYRKNPQDKDVLVKALLNEREARLPVESDVAPYYHWKDLRDYYLKKLNAYK